MSDASGDPVPAISESEATGAIKALYEDIKAVTGVPVVNLIYRHLAILPGGLAWSWGVLRPIYASGEVAQLAETLMDDLALPTLPRLAPAALRAVGVDDASEQEMIRIFESYNRSNPMNLIALLALRTFLNQPLQKRAAAVEIPEQTAPRLSVEPSSINIKPLPPLLALSDMNAHTRALVQTLNGLSPQGEARTMASMYRQLAHWPGYLALALTYLQPLHASCQLQASVDRAMARATALVQGLVVKLREDVAPRPQGDAQEQLQAALAYFTENLIVEMLPVGKLLRAAMPE